ncbi:MAG: polysaccharide biosynthesis/export family protein [Porticoccaceae bacterium]
MNKFTLIRYCMVALLAGVFSSGQLSFADDGDSQYQLGSGDIISIQVYGEEELNFDQILLTDAGTVSFPFLGEVGAKGKTAKQLENIIILGLKDGYLINPKVTVSVIEYRSFFVNGEVKEPGGYPFQPGLTLRKAIAVSGGLTERASKTKIFVIRDRDPDKQPQKITMDAPINPGDIVTIEQSFF